MNAVYVIKLSTITVIFLSTLVLTFMAASKENIALSEATSAINQ